MKAKSTPKACQEKEKKDGATAKDAKSSTVQAGLQRYIKAYISARNPQARQDKEKEARATAKEAKEPKDATKQVRLQHNIRAYETKQAPQPCTIRSKPRKPELQRRTPKMPKTP